MHGYLDAFKNYATFSGRTSRMGFWSFYLLNLLMVFSLAFTEQMLGLRLGSGPFGLLTSLYLLGTLIPWVAITVRRLHDSNLNGAWAFLYLIPFANLLLLIFALRRSTPGENAYGMPAVD